MKQIATKLESYENCKKNEVMLIEINTNLESQLSGVKQDNRNKEAVIQRLDAEIVQRKNYAYIAALGGLILGFLIAL